MTAPGDTYERELKALLAGVTTVRMVNGKDPRSIITDIKKGVPHGTVITR